MTLTSLTLSSALVALVALVPCHAIALSPLPGARTSIARPAQFSRRAAVRCSEDDDLVALLVDDDAFDDDDGGDLKPSAPPAPPAPPVLPDGEVVLETLEHGAKAMRVGVAGKELSFETGEIGRLASGTVVCKSGGTHVLSAACFERKDEVTPLDFTPLRVDYIERKSSVGRTAGGYIKRDGRPSDHETLVCRLIDRPLRPLLGNGWSLETQLTSYVLAADGEHLPDVMAICAASAALAVSQVPFAKPVAAVRVVLVGDELVVNPTKAEVAAGGGKLDLVVAGTAEAVLMIEGFADFLPEARVVDALEKGLAAVATIANAIAKWKAEVGQPPFLEGVLAPPADLGAALETWGVDAKVQAMLSGDEKKDREALLRDVQRDVLRSLCTADGAAEAGLSTTFAEAEVKAAFKARCSAGMRRLVHSTGVRQDGRSTTEVRPITIRMSPLPPSVHGSALFTRGETQSLATCTLGDSSDMQKYENLDGDQAKRFYLQYTFPPFSVGEVGRNGAPGRREVGHGNLAERSLVAALPDADDFSYSMRVESLITESCGSSSMASVCGGSLAMMAAGVPLKHAVAGVAMGMLLDEEGGGEPPIILTDILGSEDALGTMDFKVAGNEAGISTFQLDIKCEGLSIELMREALEQARAHFGAIRRAIRAQIRRNSAQLSDGPTSPLEQARDARLHILGLMKAAMPAHAASLPPAVPRMRKMRIDPTKVGRVIGTGGATIKALIEETGVANIAIDKNAEPGEIVITGFDDDAIADAQARIDAIAGGDGPPGGGGGGGARKPAAPPPPPIEVGEAFEGAEVKNVVPFGIFVELYDGLDGFCHISQLSEAYVSKMEDVGVAAGDKIDVKVTEYNKAKGQYRVAVTSPLEIKEGGGGGGRRGRG